MQVTIKDRFTKTELPQIWDLLRKKVTEAQTRLPPGAGPSSVNDDFGDVYGVYVGITGRGYTYRELKNYIDLLRRELLQVQDVKRILLWGVQPQAVYVEMQRDKMAQLGITQDEIFQKLAARNMVADAGRIHVGRQWLPISPTGVFSSEQEFLSMLISEPGADEQIYLGDVATVERGYVEPPSQILRMSYKTFVQDGKVLGREELEEIDWSEAKLEEYVEVGQPAIGLAISTVLGGNVVTMGEAVSERLIELDYLRPLGMEMNVIALQSEAVTKSINNFVQSLIEAIAIVVVVLLFFMGLKSGLLIGFILFVTIVGTFQLMSFQGILLERISLGALIIALGMLVDNAIVVTEGMKIRMERGEKGLDAAKAVVGQNGIPLLGATAVAVLAFAPIGLSDHDTGEYCRSLFFVLLFSLMFSWFTAVTTTPLFSSMLFKKSASADSGKDPYAGGFFRIYRTGLEAAMRFRYAVIPAVYAMFVVAMLGFGTLPPGFFPASARPQYYVDIWMPEGTHIRDTEAVAGEIEQFVMERDNSLAIADHVGSGGARFLLTYSPEQANTSYAQLLVTVKSHTEINDDIDAIEKWAAGRFPDATVYGKRFKLGPGEGGNIQLRVSGPERNKIREIAGDMRRLMLEDPHVKYVRTDWQDPVQVVQPVIARQQARRTGIDRPDVANRMAAAFQGYQVGVFREGDSAEEDRLMPIITRPPIGERTDIRNIDNLQIYSPAADRMIPMRQVTAEFETVFEDANIRRRNRRLTLTLHSDQTVGESAETWQRLDPRIKEWFEQKYAEGMSPEYFFEWGPEYEDAEEAIGALAAGIPGFFVLMVFIVICLFNNIRQPLIIWLTVPLAMIGVVLGLWIFSLPFNFMAILGTLSLSGMLIKNAIVLIDEVNLNLRNELAPYEAVVQAGVSRLRPVSMAAATTVLGMLPLLGDVFFVSMAVAVMFGLTFATVLTLLVVPTLYVTLYRIPSPSRS